MRSFLALLLLVPALLQAQSIRLLTNHVGYEYNKTKHAIVMADTRIPLSSFQLVDANTGKTV